MKLWQSISAMLVTLSATGALAGPHHPHHPHHPSAACVLHEQEGWGSQNIPMTPGQEIPYLNEGWGERTTYVYVRPGCTLELYGSEYYDNYLVTVYPTGGGMQHLGEWASRAHSAGCYCDGAW